MLREVISEYIQEHQYNSALYWADKLVTLTNSNEDIYTMCKCLLQCKHYYRVYKYIISRKLHQNHLGCCYIAAESQYLLDNHQMALELLEAEETIKLVEENNLNLKTNESNVRLRSILGRIHCLKGRILEKIENRELATLAYKTAIEVDPFCYEAFEALKDHHLLTGIEEKNLLNCIGSKDDINTSLVRALFSIDLKKYDRPGYIDLPAELAKYEKNSDLRVAIAERYYYNCDNVSAYEITCDIMREDPLHHKCVPLHISLLVEMKETIELFRLGHSLVKHYPEWSIAWYAVGCYYFLIGKQDSARKHLSKATDLDSLFGPSWLVFGHSFAQEKEHDQAMAVYQKAAMLMPGCHLPLLYIGMEYSITNNHPFAEKFLKEARKIAPNDPFVLHELGVTAFNVQDYDAAEKYYTLALNEIKSINESAGEVSSGLSDKWEALLNNLGHTYRKQERYKEALAYFKQALVLSPLNPSTYSSIGFVMSLTNDLSGAVEYFHRALSLRPEDTFSTTMLNEVIERHMSEIDPFPDYPDQIPRFGPLGGTSGVENSTADDLNLNTSSEMGNDSSLQGNISTSDMTGPDGLLTPINTDSQQTLGDASNLSIDCEMESISRTPTDFDLDNSLKD